MPYAKQMNNPLGASDFLSQMHEQDYQQFKEIKQIIENLSSSLQDSSVKRITPASTSHRLVSIAVDGGSSLLFPEFREISLGMIRVCAYSDDLEAQPEPVIKVIKNYELFDFHKNTPASAALRQKREALLKAWFNEEPLKTFSAETRIALEDLGDHIYKDLQSFTNIVRSVLEWAYIVSVAKRYKEVGIKVAIVRDGRLEQHGVKESFVTKLRQHFEKQRTRLVGIVKSTKLLYEGIPAMVIHKWIEQHGKQALIYFRVPNELMEYTFAFERQWNPDYDGSFVFGHRYIGKFFPETFAPLQGVITFDIPYYFSEDDHILEEIVSTLYNYRTVLYDGSISLVSEAHEQASISGEVSQIVENELREQIKRRAELSIPVFRR